MATPPDFVKLFTHPMYGQILVVNGRTDDDDPAVLVSCTPPGLGICTLALVFEDTDEGYDKRDAGFAKTDEALAVGMVHKIFKESAPFAATEH